MRASANILITCSYRDEDAGLLKSMQRTIFLNQMTCGECGVIKAVLRVIGGFKDDDKLWLHVQDAVCAVTHKHDAYKVRILRSMTLVQAKIMTWFAVEMGLDQHFLRQTKHGQNLNKQPQNLSRSRRGICLPQWSNSTRR